MKNSIVSFIFTAFVVGASVFAASSSTMSSTEIDEMNKIVNKFVKDFADWPEMISEDMKSYLLDNLKTAIQKNTEPDYVDYFRAQFNQMLSTVIASKHIHNRAQLQALAFAVSRLFTEMCCEIITHIGGELRVDPLYEMYDYYYLPPSVDNFGQAAMNLDQHFQEYITGETQDLVLKTPRPDLGLKTDGWNWSYFPYDSNLKKRNETPMWKQNLYAHVVTFANFARYFTESSTLSHHYDEFLAAQETQGFPTCKKKTLYIEDIKLLHALVDPDFTISRDDIKKDSRLPFVSFIKPLVDTLAGTLVEPNSPSLLQSFLDNIVSSCCCCWPGMDEISYQSVLPL